MSSAPQTTGGIYSAEQIRIPPELPEILKNYAKFIIKTQPTDIITSSQQYFQKLSSQGKAAGKDGKLTSAQLSTFLKKFSVGKPSVSKQEIKEACEWADISENQKEDTLSMGGWTTDQVPWISFWSFLVASAAGNFMATIFQIISIGSENGTLPPGLFRAAFDFLVEQDKSVKSGFIHNVKAYLSNAGSVLQSDKLVAVLTEFNENADIVLPSKGEEGEEGAQDAAPETENGDTEMEPPSATGEVEMSTD